MNYVYLNIIITNNIYLKKYDEINLNTFASQRLDFEEK